MWYSVTGRDRQRPSREPISVRVAIRDHHHHSFSCPFHHHHITMADVALLKQLVIKTGVVNRLSKEVSIYNQEHASRHDNHRPPLSKRASATRDLHHVAHNASLPRCVLGTTGRDRIRYDSLRPKKLYELRKHDMCVVLPMTTPPPSTRPQADLGIPSQRQRMEP